MLQAILLSTSSWYVILPEQIVIIYFPTDVIQNRPSSVSSEVQYHYWLLYQIQ